MEEKQHDRLTSRLWSVVVLVLTIVGLLLTINNYFYLEFFMGVTLMENALLFNMLAIFLSLTFIVYPASKKSRDRVPWYDVVLFIICIGTCAYFSWHATDIVTKGWEFKPPMPVLIFAIVMFGMAVEAERRAGGTTIFLVVLIVALYPLVAKYMPMVLRGFTLSFGETVSYHILSTESLLGVPMRTFADLFIGFILMGAAFEVTGGGDFFLKLATALAGRYRGGPAKVAIFASALIGTMMGAPVSNVITTGPITIPAMKRIGYSGTFAGAIEACASTGSALMPPVMAATAFLMASFLKISYWKVCVAAAIPSLLYYFSLLMQIDGHAARLGLKGLPREEIPSVWATLKQGWFYLFAVVLLIWLLAYLRREAQAPFYATAALLLAATVRKETRMNRQKWQQFVITTGRLLVQLVAILAAVGFIVGALLVTGVAMTFSGRLVDLAGGNSLLLVIFGAIVAFILGLPMTPTAVYIFLAIVLAPALVQTGMLPIAAHMFMLYWAIMGCITPPVAIPAFAAAAIARADPMETTWAAVRLGFVLYLLPFFFIFNPMLLLQNVTPAGLAISLGTSVAGIILIAAGYSAYIIGVGPIRGRKVATLLSRSCLVVGGTLLAWPAILPSVIGLVIVLPVIVVYLISNRRRAASARVIPAL